MASYVPGASPRISVGWSTHHELDKPPPPPPPPPVLVFEFQFEVKRTREIDGVSRVVEWTHYPSAAVSWDFRRFVAERQSRDQFIRKLEKDAPALSFLPPRTRESLRRDFAGQVRKAVSRCGAERGLKELRVVARVTVAIESGLAADRCPICLDEFGEEQHQQVLLNFGILGCGHGFHYRCIRTWLELASTCPVCRHVI
uniref:RING-type domain-containing protein n=1 Tax=Ananas comosus var. bracteatus TaxID=296719 RepID=A0A6V7PVC5_ANACO|nr:unnamed protein product [Ananas comosus var. bracteatus]